MRRTLLLISDLEARGSTLLRESCIRPDCDVVRVFGLATAAAEVARHRPAVVVLAFTASNSDRALALVSEFRQKDRRLPVLVAVEQGSEAVAAAALRAGVKDYFPLPIVAAAFETSLRNWLDASRLIAAVRDTPVRKPGSASPAAWGGACPLVTASRAMREVAAYLACVAQQDATVLITGETGTGKELVASMIHQRSPRYRERFLSVNCAAIPDGLLESELFGHEAGAFTGAMGRREGLLEAADKGTIFLDEIGDMAAAGQAKILRVLETRELYRVGGKRAVPFNVRVVAATNQDLEQAVEVGRFRKDLFFRLNVARVHLPPLRERRSDIRALLDLYVSQLNAERSAHVAGFTDAASAALEAYDWPGNVRELRNMVEAVFVAAPPGRVSIDDLPATFRARLKTVTGPASERRRLLDALLAANWNKSQAAVSLRWSRMTIYRKMAKHSLVRPG